MTAAEVYLPCDVGRVRVKLGFGDTLSPLEETALRVIAALSPLTNPETPDPPPEPAGPCAEIGMVATLLGLGYRVVLDLVHDLWREGYLVVDFSTNTIGLTQDVQDMLASGELAKLQGAEAEDSTAELMVERLTGHVMPAHGSSAPADPRLALRFLATDTGLAEASHADIEQAVRSWLIREKRGRERRILSIRSAPEDRATGAGRRWYQLAVQAEVNPDTDDLIISVTDRRFPAERRERAADRLTRLAQEKPLETWVTQLRSAAEQRLVTPPPVEEVIGRLAARIAAGTTLPAGTRRAEHLEWADESRRITGLVDDRIAREADVVAIFGGEAHAAVVSRLINEARTQLVLVSPRIVDYVLERFRPQLQDAVDRGVQIVILWGGEYKGKLSEHVRNGLDSLSRRAKTVPVLRAQVSANTSVRMVVCDNRVALLTSRDLLSTTRERPEAGLLLRCPEGRDSAVLSDLLGWTRVNMPGAQSTSVLRHADRFGDLADPGRDRRTETRRERLPEDPPEDIAENGAVQAWVMRWEAHIAGLRAELASRPLPYVRIIEDGAHRELLWQALRKAQRRVVIASGQISDEVINSRLVDAITMLIARDVAVTIGYDAHGGADRGQGALAALADLAETYPTLLTLYGGVGHARALVWDDDVTVGSYGYLFHAGYGTVGGRHMLPSELSARLTDPALADEIAAACGEPPEVTARVTGRVDVRGKPTPVIDQGVLSVAQRILNRAGDPRPGELIKAELRPVADPWPVVDILHRLGSPVIRRTAIAYCLARGAPDAGTDVRWRDRLITELVNSGMFTEAQILRGGGPTSPASQAPFATDEGAADMAVTDTAAAPRPTILAALSRRGGPAENVLLTAAFEAELRVDEQAALRAVCIGELLETGSSDACDALEILARSDGAWEELTDLAMAYYQGAMGAPTAELMREVSRQRRADAWLGAAWDRLEIALIEAEPIPMTLDGAKKTKAALFKETGVLGRLRAMAGRRDLSAVRALVAAEFPARPMVAQVAGDLLDRTWRDVAPLSGLLYGKPRAKYIKRLAEVVSAARDLASAGEPAGATTEAQLVPELLVAASELAEGYQRLRPFLEDSGGTGPMAAAVASDVLARLDRLTAGLSAEPDVTDPHDVAGGAADAGANGEDTLRGRVPRWAGQWRYPELAVALWASEPDPAHASALLLRDLVDPLSPAQTAQRLIEYGEFAAVEALRTQVALPAHGEPALLRQMQAAQAKAGSRARYEAASLTRRARRAGLEDGLDLDLISEQAQHRRADADDALDEFRDRVDRAEDDLAKDLLAAIDAHPAVLAGHDEETGADALAVGRWQRSVRACVKAHEFASARNLLGRGPGEPDIHDPRAFVSPRPGWPFPAETPEAVLSWYFADDEGAPPTFRTWRPSSEDRAAWGVLEALRAHLRESSARSATQLRNSLQRLVGSNHLAGAVTASGTAWTGRLCLPENGPLPRLSLLGRDGVALWIAESGTPPQDLSGATVVWLVTDFGQPEVAPPGTMVLDLPFLLRLLASTETGTLSTEGQLVNLVRRLGAQLDARQLIGDPQPASKPFSDTDVAWLLDLLGAGNDAVVAEALRFDTGGRPEILIPLLGELLTPPTPGPGRYRPLDAPMLHRAWDEGAWRAEALHGLVSALRGESAALSASIVLMWVAAAFYDDDFALDDLPAVIRLAAATQKQADACLRSADLPDAARLLRQVGIFERDGGRWRLPANGIRELLAGVWPEHDPVKQARDAISAWFRHHEQTAALSRAELSDDVVRTIGHWMANRMAAARSARNRDHPERAWQIVADIDSVHEMYRAALDGEDVLPLWDVLSDRKNETEFINPDFRVTLPADKELAGLCVLANAWLLGHAFQNLLDNARQEFEVTGHGFGEARVTVTVLEPLSADTERLCQVDIEDGGTGIDARVLAKFAAGEEFSSGRGRGTGLKTSRRWFEEYRGGLEIMAAPGRLGGAWVRVTLPLVPAGGNLP